LKIVQQRGDIEGGGVKFVLVGYGNCPQFVRPVGYGHTSVAIEPTTDPLTLVSAIERTLA
jgi:hypothetical protein